ncbi:MAG: AI-2E family transporter [Pseudomonadota bacterium]|nr:AI-2E family transporter [Pseudomonadota bacterium]
MGFNNIIKNRGYFLLAAITALSFLFFFAIVSPFILTISLSGIFAVGLTPLVEKIRKKYGIGRQRIVIGIIILVIMVFTSLTSLCIFRIYDLSLGADKEKTIAFLKGINNSVGTSSAYLETRIQSSLSVLGIKSNPKLGQQSQAFMTKIGEWSLQISTKFFSMLPEFFVHFLVFILMLFLFFRFGKKLRGLLLRSRLVTAEEVDTVNELLQSSGGTMLSANFIVGMVQASVVTLAAFVVGLNEWAIIFTLTFICSFIPVIGAGPIGLFLAGLCFSMGMNGAAVFMIVISFVSGTIDNIIRPYLVARSEENLNPIISLIGLIGAVSVFGFPGIFLGPFVMSVASSSFPKLLSAIENQHEVPTKI